MCGIAGIIDFNHKSNLNQLEKMHQAMHHRGPDGFGMQWFEQAHAQIGLAHKRLSIIDLSEMASQPMSYKHLWITFNGEIYNYKEIQKKLIDLGHTFQSQSDTEVILHAFEAWGTECVDQFRGMFAFVIYDSNKEQLYFFRDRSGIKPFFYFEKDGLILFGSELKVLMAHPNFQKNICLNAVAAFMDLGYVPTPHTIFQNCFKLKPGHWMQINLKNKEKKEVSYWNVNTYYQKPKLDISYQEAIVQTEAIIKESFEYRMVSDVPVGVFLSGGYDSVSVTALLQKNRKTPLKTFTIGVQDAHLDEAPFAKEIAKYLGTEHATYYCTEQEMIDLLPQLPYYYDEPFADSSAIPTILVSRMASKDVKVVLSADAGDEVFGGYNRYDYASKMDRITNSPKWLKKSISHALKWSHRAPFFKNPLWHQRIHKVNNLLNSDQKHVMHAFTSHFNENELKLLMQKPFSGLNTLFEETLNAPYLTIEKMMAADYQNYLIDDILTKVDRATMSASIEGREPFLDHHIIEFAAQLPIDYKYHKGAKKRILKDIVHQYVPKELMQRPKMGFAIPLKKWLHSHILPMHLHFFEPIFIEKQGIFNPEAILRIKTDFAKATPASFLQIWHYVVFQMWYEKWMEN
jgi:asparagine synthase (glutamine-hydrolysing)